MDLFAIPPDVGVWAPIRGREFLLAGTGLAYCDGHGATAFYLTSDLRRDVCDLLDGLLADFFDDNLEGEVLKSLDCLRFFDGVKIGDVSELGSLGDHN